MWEWSKKIVTKIDEAKCLNEKNLHQVEIAMRLFEATMTIQSLLNGKKELFMKPLCKDDFEDRISEWAKTVISDIDKSDCLSQLLPPET